jgi:hypothetical protein
MDIDDQYDDDAVSDESDRRGIELTNDEMEVIALAGGLDPSRVLDWARAFDYGIYSTGEQRATDLAKARDRYAGFLLSNFRETKRQG